MKPAEKLQSKIVRAFLLQVGLVSLAALLGVYASKFVLEDILIRQALRDEAVYFWQRFKTDNTTPLPDTRNMKAYLLPLTPRTQIPGEVQGLPPGYHKLHKGKAVVAADISEAENTRLILIFDGQRVEELATFFGLVPLVGSLIVLYTAALIGYRLSQRAISPIIQLAEEVSRIDPQLPDSALRALENLSTPISDKEVLALSEALAGLSSRLRRFIERERVFTRDASHELRSPITVIRIAADLLLADAGLAPSNREKVLRIKRVARDMEDLTDVFLHLARESELGPIQEAVCLNDIAIEEMENSRPRLLEKPIEMTFSAESRLHVEASVKVLSVLVGNLIRNACAYTESGFIRVSVTRDSLLVEDSGSGIPRDQMDKIFSPFCRGSAGGYGVGLAIVRRFCERFDWPLEIDSTPGEGTRVSVGFPQGRYEPTKPQPNNRGKT